MNVANEAGNQKFPKREFIFEAVLLALIVLATFIFLKDGIWDLKLAAKFYHPENLDSPWFEQDQFLWKFFYFAAPVLTGIFIFPSLVVYTLSFVKEKFAIYRKQSLFVILIVLVGPGILVNTIFKPGWGRPRPREVIELGGTKVFQTFTQRGEPRSGMSFPCGHCSVGFSTIALYFLMKRRRKKVAIVIGAAATGLGLLMGVGRMADGAHFFSDVIWAGLMTYIPAFVFYYKLRLYEDQKIGSLNPKRATIIAISFTLVLLVAVSLATPYKKKTIQEFAGNQLEFAIDEGTVEIVVDDSLLVPAQIYIDVQGFGFPKSGINQELVENKSLSIQKHGFFTDFEAHYKLKISGKLEALNVKIQNKGSILKPQNLNPNFVFSQP